MARACYPEPFAAAQGKLREGSVSMGVEMLRYAQHDSVVRLLSPCMAIPATPHQPRSNSICWAFLVLMTIRRP
jgi:hypothetical protein